jgi:hypothetical protein
MRNIQYLFSGALPKSYYSDRYSVIQMRFLQVNVIGLRNFLGERTAMIWMKSRIPLYGLGFLKAFHI